MLRIVGAEGQTLHKGCPGVLPAWQDLWREPERIGARLVVIDPALSAYVGGANAAEPVRDCIGVLTERASAIGAGVLLVAHSRKDARAKPDPFDPGNVAGSTHWTRRGPRCLDADMGLRR